MNRVTATVYGGSADTCAGRHVQELPHRRLRGQLAWSAPPCLRLWTQCAAVYGRSVLPFMDAVCCYLWRHFTAICGSIAAAAVSRGDAAIYGGSIDIHRGNSAIYGGSAVICGGNSAIYVGNIDFCEGNAAIYGGSADIFGCILPESLAAAVPFMLAPCLTSDCPHEP
eukprot:1104702-Rhodomonas_salina.2